MIVQTRALQPRLVHLESERLDEVQVRAGGRGESDCVAGVLRYPRFVERETGIPSLTRGPKFVVFADLKPLAACDALCRPFPHDVVRDLHRVVAVAG